MDASYPVYTPPLYAILIALGESLFSDEQLPIKIFQILLDSCTGIIIYVIARDCLGDRIGMFSGFGWALYPFAIYATLYIGSEAVFTFFLCLFLLMVMKGIRYEAWQYYLGAGAALGVATLVRGTTQFLLVFLLAVLIISHRYFQGSIMRGYVLVLLSFAIVLAPWAIRNYFVLHEFVPVATAGSVLLQGSSDEFLTIEHKERYPEYYERLKQRGIQKPSDGIGPVDMDRFLMRVGIENYKMRMETQPFSLVPFMVKKFLRLWYSTESGNNEWMIISINSIIYVPALFGLVLAWKKREQYLWLVAPIILYFIFLHWITLPLFRYMLPVMPLVIVFAGIAVLKLSEEVFGKTQACSNTGEYLSGKE